MTAAQQTELDASADAVGIDASTDTTLAQLHAAYPEAKAAADAAAERLKTITDGIKAKLTELGGEARKVALTGEHGPTLELTRSVSTRFDSRRMKADAAARAAAGDASLSEFYAAYTSQSTSFTLRVKGGA